MTSAGRLDLPVFTKQGELEGTELETRLRLVEMLTSLCRAILQSSYYTDDHPMSRRVAQAPYDLLKQLGDLWKEYTIIVTSWTDEETTALDGVFTEPVALETLVGGTAGEHFAKKMLTFCQRNRLVSFSIKDIIGQDEFHRFIRVFVERHVDMDALKLIDDYQDRREFKFTEQLLEANVLNVTVVLESDIVDEKRRLPWRVKVAMARLRKDLRVIPLFSRATEFEIRGAKLRLLRDILRPLRRGVYLKQLFLNLDLITAEVSEFQDVDLEADLLDALPIDRLVTLGEALATDVERQNRPGLEEKVEVVRADLEETLQRLLHAIGLRLAESLDDPTAVDLLRELYRLEMVPISSLPREVQEQITLDRWTSSFLVDPNEFLALFDSVESAHVYVAQLPNVVGIFPNLLRVRKFDEARKIIDLLHQHRSEPGGFEGRMELVDAALARMDNREVFRLLVKAMHRESREIRAVVRALFVELGAMSVPPLVQVLEVAESDAVCSDAALTLVSLGRQVLAPMHLLLRARKIQRRTARYLLKVVAELGDPSSARLVTEYLRHPDAAVRDAALEATFKILKDRSVPALFSALSDRHPPLVIRALTFLDRLGTRDASYVARLLELARVIEPEDGREPDERVQIAALALLSRVGNVRLGVLGDLETQLIGRLDATHSSRMDTFLGRELKASESVRAAVVTVLARIGGGATLDRLENTRGESALMANHMQRALTELEERMVGQSSS